MNKNIFIKLQVLFTRCLLLNYTCNLIANVIGNVYTAVCQSTYFDLSPMAVTNTIHYDQYSTVQWQKYCYTM